MNHQNRNRILSRRMLALGTLAAAMTAGSTGCNNALEGGATGAAFGALAGMGLGALSGNMGEGAAAGAILGGLGGAIIGDQNQRHSRPVHYGPGYPQHGGHYHGGYNSYPY